MKKVAAIGVGMTKIKATFERGLRDLFSTAALEAIEDSKNAVVKALFVGNMSASKLGQQSNLGPLLCEYAGLGNIPAVRVEGACGSGGAAMVEGYSAVASGLYDTVMVAGVEKMTEFPTGRVTAALVEAADQEYEAFHGATFPAINAMIMRYYMDHYKIPREDFALWPVAMHEHATKNPLAQLPFQTTVEKVLRSSMVAEPLSLFDCAPVGDGAAAVILADMEIAKEYTDTPVEMVGIGEATDTLAIQKRDDLTSLKATKLAAQKALTMANVKVKDIDVMEVHDAFTIMGFLALEDLGFVEKGQANQLLKEDQINKDGEIPTNMSGGLKARGHPVGATGVYQLAEITKQLQGEAKDMQVDGAEVGLVHNIGGSGARVAIGVLRRTS